MFYTNVDPCPVLFRTTGLEELILDLLALMNRCWLHNQYYSVNHSHLLLTVAKEFQLTEIPQNIGILKY